MNLIPGPNNECSLGTVVGYSDNNYLILTPNDALIGKAANGTPSQDSVENDITNPPPPIIPVPPSVTPLQMRRALNITGLRDVVEAAVSSSTKETKDAWEFATEILRNDPILDGVSTALNKTSQEVDDLFRLAGTK